MSSACSLVLCLGFLLIACSRQDRTPPVVAALTESPLAIPSEPIPFSAEADTIVLSLEENGYAHLFAYQPATRPLTRLTYGDWSDIAPASSPDGRQLAFASNRNGFWDLYLLDVHSGGVTQLTDTPEYDSAPSWSPDGHWLVFESYMDDNLEIAIISVAEPAQNFIRLTENPASDHSPAWAPDGRRIAFVSTRGGDSDIWLADLDIVDGDRFQDLSNTRQAAEGHPAWSTDGSRLLWASSAQTVGYSGIYVWEAGDGLRPPRWVGDGSWATWNESADALVAGLITPNQQYLTSFKLDADLLIAPILLPGRLRGLTWDYLELPDPLPASLAQPAAQTPSVGWAPAITPAPDVPSGRWYLVELVDVQAPYPQMHDLVDESFSALRDRMLSESGWDALASLQNAFVPLSTSLDPGMQADWLYTGRAFAINSLMATAGWMVALREDYGAQTYWRLYIRCTLQDGSRGEPIHDAPWDLTSRYDLDPLTYEQGGKYVPVPGGYWVDVTGLAAAFGWERLAALPNWRSYYGGTRFTEFALTGGLDWYSAMLELYPAGALVTPTHVLPPTVTPTRTPRPSITPGPSSTPRPTITPSRTPTATGTPPPTPTPPTIIP